MDPKRRQLLTLFATVAAAQSLPLALGQSTPDPHAKAMRLAIEQGQKNPRFPYGAVLVDVKTSVIVAEGFNQSHLDPTFHGEMVTLHEAARKHPKLAWSQTVLYSTAEPCPMCQAAIEWAGIGRVYYGTSLPFLKKLGDDQIDLRASEVAARASFRQTKIVGGVLEEECNALFVAAQKVKA